MLVLLLPLLMIMLLLLLLPIFLLLLLLLLLLLVHRLKVYAPVCLILGNTRSDSTLESERQFGGVQ